MNVTVGTFNLNNLFDRFNFQADLGALPAEERDVRTVYSWEFVGQGTGQHDPPPQLDTAASSSPIVRIQKNSNGALLKGKSDSEQQAIADRIMQINVDVLAVQEVENLDALRRFNRDVIAQPYEFEALIEGNDPRFIDVGVLSRLPLANLTSHRFEVHDDDPLPIFGRDLLEVDVMSPTRSRRLFKMFVNHLKSQFIPFNAPDPRTVAENNDTRRTRQAETAAKIINSKTRPNSKFVVLGDMNDSPDADTLNPMVGGLVDALANVTESQPPPHSTNPEDVPPNVRWTHRFSVSNAPDKFELFDQIWLSNSLAGRLGRAEINRRPKWNASSQGVGSDHDPVFIELESL